GVVVGRRGVGPGAVAVSEQRRSEERRVGIERRQAFAFDVGGIGQQLGLGDQPCAAVLGNRRQGDRRRGRRVVDRGDVQRGGAGDALRIRAAVGGSVVGDRVAERNRGVVVGRRGVGPGAVAVSEQR